MKRKVVVIPSLLIGLAIGGLGVTAFAANNPPSTSTVSSAQSSTHSWGYGGMMGQTSGTDGAGNWSNVMGGMMNTYYGTGPLSMMQRRIARRWLPSSTRPSIKQATPLLIQGNPRKWSFSEARWDRLVPRWENISWLTV